MKKTALYSQRVILPNGIQPTAVCFTDTITHIVSRENIPDGYEIIDVGDAVVMAGLIDAHVHINEPGRTEWEGFETATKSAVSGGITTIIDMPLNSSPVTSNIANFDLKLAAADGKLYCNVGFYAGIVPDNVDDISALLDAGVLGVKAFMCHSGIDEFPDTGATEFRQIMPLLAERNIPLLVHAELVAPLETPVTVANTYADYLASRPDEWEVNAIRELISLVAETNCHVHIVHLATAEAVAMLQAARAEGLPISVETAPHYLYFDAETIPDGNCRYKCAPPIRSAANRRQLWQAVEDGVIDMIATDHSPCPPELKKLDTGDFMQAWGGISSLQLLLPATWTAARKVGIPLEKLAQLLSGFPAKMLRLDQQKGQLAVGFDADITVWQPEQSFTCRGEALQHKHKLTPYDGADLFGVVEQTWLNGQLVWKQNEFKLPPSGNVQRGSLIPNQ